MQEGAVLEEVEIELKANRQDGRFIEEVFMTAHTSACASHRARQWHRQYLHGMVDARRDKQGLARLADRCGKDFRRGILLYAELNRLPLDDTHARRAAQ